MGTVGAMPLPKRISSLAALALTLATVAACGGSSDPQTVSVSTWVKSFCGAVRPFEQSVVNRSNAFSARTFASTTAKRQAFAQYLAAIASDTSRASSQVQGAGTPSIKNGKPISQAIVNAFTQANETMTNAANQAKSLPTSSPQAFTAGAQRLVAAVRSSMSNIGTKLQSSTLKSPALEQAAARESSCQSLGG
jgi:hypothetical protein